MADTGKALEEDIPTEGVAGKIALIQRGGTTFEQKVARVADAGARAAVIYNSAPGLFRGDLANQAQIPAVSVSRKTGEAMLQRMSDGDVEATVSVTTQTLHSQNVIADKAVSGGDDRVVVLGAHYDTVPDVPGANDNGSGVATVITVARDISEKELPFTLRLIAFGMEELGLFGSMFYVDSLSVEERNATEAMLNFDALAVGELLGVLGDADLVTKAIELGRERGITLKRTTLPPNTSSDHATFEVVGIPVIFFLDEEFTRIHTPEDKLEYVYPRSMGSFAAVAVDLLEWLAQR